MLMNLMMRIGAFFIAVILCGMIPVLVGCEQELEVDEEPSDAGTDEPGDADDEDAGDAEGGDEDTGDGEDLDAGQDADADEGPEYTVGTEHYQQVPMLLTFPLESSEDYNYERSWHDCRPSESDCERAHRAIEIDTDAGTPVFAGADGEVAWRNTDISTDSGGGYQLHIDTDDPDLRLVYAHLGENTKHRAFRAIAENPDTGRLWDVGDTVQEGDHIGYVGDSGGASQPQLQVEIRSRIDGEPEETDQESDRAYGDPDATPGTFNYLRFDPYDTLKAAEQEGVYPDGSDVVAMPDPEFGTDYYRDVPRLVMFPLEEDASYDYERAWDDCRPSATNCTRAHRAVDIYDDPGTPIYAGADGEIAWRNTDITIGSGGGYQLHIDPDGNPELRLAYAHFGPDEHGAEDEAFAENPRTGQIWDTGDTVYEGEKLGYLGTSGATASGPHLHFEVRSRMPGLPDEETSKNIDYGDPNATLGTFDYLRFDSWDTLQLAEELEIYP